ncbi:MAG: D-arabinose 5-phosphate [Alphaproteobacteria bacterium RIFCSPHIGHO2_12_FULL_45_9]|nr:MAG: D-arabinose 5-phosphate [Alphaproteobacteria bacterium RIFCSPHIGHO2_02_FULL_46_13]OFW98036.1 MAG: D-arabinose 5-phosphate [Alphaproteobacteria bacterium RIFCSPHIGHO2_12_FULL_45_9]
MADAVTKLSPAIDDLSSARRTLATEIEGLNALAKSLDQNFVKAIEVIQAMKDKGRGRLIVAGIGKSGHIARKIAATLASTATPAYHIHPGEASHGDLGMITEDDVIIMMSFSGTNAELTDMTLYAKRFHIPLIAITGNPESQLAQYADIALILPKIPEACPNGLAPTTSTTMMLGLGDAMAIALLERAGLTAEAFRVWHPGGKLGAKLRKVSDLMVKGNDLPFVTADTTMDKAIITLSEKNLGSVIIVDGDKNLLGIITDGDLKRHMAADLLSRKASDIMSHNPRTISPNILAAEALDIMLNSAASPITSLIIADEQKHVLGLIRIQELLKAGIA